MPGRKVAPKVDSSLSGRHDEAVFIQHAVTSGVYTCAVHLCTHVHQCAGRRSVV